MSWKFGIYASVSICASCSIRANRRVKKERNKQTKKRKKERYILLILRCHHRFQFYHTILSFLPFPHVLFEVLLNAFGSFFVPLFRRGRKNLCTKSSKKKSGEFPGRGIQRRCRGPPFCGNDDSRSRRRNQRLLKESFCDDDDVVVVVYASRRDSDDY